MASSNRHWPSMFKSKPCSTQHQWQHDINSSLLSNSGPKTPYSSVPGSEERSPEPKPRWNPKPEQIRILEAIFNSGMVNPPRDEIRKIRAQLQEYGQVGDANVFYWFQNRKSRSKHKNRNLQTTKTQHSHPSPLAVPSSSSSSSEKSETPKKDKALALTNLIDVSNSPTGSVNQTYFQNHMDFSAEPFHFPVQHGALSHGCCFSELSNVINMSEQGLGPGSGLFYELMSQEASKKEEVEKMKMEQHHSFVTTGATTATTATTSTNAFNEMQGIGNTGSASASATAPSVAARSTVFINDVAFDVAVGPLNVRQAFGDDAVLLHSSGHPVLTNEWGVTLLPLQHGAFYYLV
ncbi:homeobox-3 [Tasmannia lanceolata]|uniref:homeobox-3 n=1 Tax=Tasmannia lanceolata TaxID=3420 RepID=UPI00406372B7